MDTRINMLLRCLFLALVMQVTAASPDIDTKEARATINGREYLFSSIDGTAMEAIISCGDLGMELASFETLQESVDVSTYIADTLQLSSRIYWVSAQRMYNTWMWMGSGVYLTYNNWEPGKPTETGSVNQACVALLNANFRDALCHNNYFFICEQRLPCP